MEPRWDNIALTLGSLVLLWLAHVILGAVSPEEARGLLFAPGADRARIDHLVTLAVILGTVVAVIGILSGRSRRAGR